MSVIVNIRGTSGSGKSTLVRKLMGTAASVEPLVFRRLDEHTTRHDKAAADQKPTDYRLDHPLGDIFVVGRYETACGGCDGIKTQDEICDRVRHYAQFGHVVFEGLLISHLFSRYEALARELQGKGHRYVTAFLNTPLDVCLQRVQQRRLARGNTKPLNTKNTEDKHRDSARVYGKFVQAGLEAVWINYTTPLADTSRLFGEQE